MFRKDNSLDRSNTWDEHRKKSMFGSFRISSARSCGNTSTSPTSIKTRKGCLGYSALAFVMRVLLRVRNTRFSHQILVSTIHVKTTLASEQKDWPTFASRLYHEKRLPGLMIGTWFVSNLDKRSVTVTTMVISDRMKYTSVGWPYPSSA